MRVFFCFPSPKNASFYWKFISYTTSFESIVWFHVKSAHVYKTPYFLQKYSSTFFTGIWRTLTVFQSNWKNIPTPLERWLNMELTDLIKFTKSTRSKSWLNLRKNEVGFHNSVYPTFSYFIAYKIVSFCCCTWLDD